jgi:hypothetical protein
MVSVVVVRATIFEGQGDIMSKARRHAVLGLSIAAASVAVARPAGAYVFKHYQNHAVCLGVKAGLMTHGTPIVTWDCNGHADQNWNLQPYWGSYYQLWTSGSAAPPHRNAQCIALRNDGSTQVLNGAIIWECSASTTDQGWELVYVLNDSSNHPCYYFKNKKAYDQTGTTMVLTVDSYPQAGVASPVYLYWWAAWGTWAQQLWCAY